MWNNNDRWITITPAPGVTRDQVIIQPAGIDPSLPVLLRVHHIAFSNVTIDCVMGSDFKNEYTESIWLDKVSISSSDVLGPDDELGQPISYGWQESFLTNSTVHHFPGRGPAASFVRNVQETNLGDDAFDNPSVIINVSVKGIHEKNPGDHIDALQYFAAGDLNSIVYNYQATDVAGQLIFIACEGSIDPLYISNIAIVNYLGVCAEGPGGGGAQVIGTPVSWDHILFRNITLPNQSFASYDCNAGVTATNCEINGMVAWMISAGSQVAIHNSHIIDAADEATGNGLPPGIGTGYTTGDPGFISSAVRGGATDWLSADFFQRPNRLAPASI